MMWDIPSLYGGKRSVLLCHLLRIDMGIYFMFIYISSISKSQILQKGFEGNSDVHVQCLLFPPQISCQVEANIVA